VAGSPVRETEISLMLLIEEFNLILKQKEKPKKYNRPPGPALKVFAKK